MSRRSIATQAAACLALAGSILTVQAADLPYEERYGSAYEDQRYADIYGHAPPRPKTYTYRYEAVPPPPPPPAYGYDAPPIPRERVYRDGPYRDYGYKDDYRDYERDRYAGRPGCVPKDEVRYDLERRGWHGFHDPQVIDRDTASIKARRPSGRPFELKVDRCTGEILAQRPLDPYGYGPYADRSRRDYRY